jgi:hypothetical protein
MKRSGKPRRFSRTVTQNGFQIAETVSPPPSVGPNFYTEKTNIRSLYRAAHGIGIVHPHSRIHRADGVNVEERSRKEV